MSDGQCEQHAARAQGQTVGGICEWARPTEGLAVGLALGPVLGLALGPALGPALGDVVGPAVGLRVGLAVGAAVVLQRRPLKLARQMQA